MLCELVRPSHPCSNSSWLTAPCQVAAFDPSLVPSDAGRVVPPCCAPMSAKRQPSATAGIWTPGGVSSDGKSVFAVTGNTEGATAYSDGNGVFKFQAGPVFKYTAPNYFAPSQWKQYDDNDVDLCGSEPVVLDLPGALAGRLS